MKIQAVPNGAEIETSRPANPVRRRDDAVVPVSGAPVGGSATPSAVAPVQQVEKSKEMERLAEEFQRHFRDNPSKLDISLDKELKVIVTKVLEADTGEVIRQYPPESILEVMKYLRSQRGLIVNQKG